MYSSTTLDIRGHRGQAVPNAFFAQDSASHHLAVVFPGLGYTAHMPVWYYPRSLLLGVWLTPLLRNDRLRAQMGRAGDRSLSVIGTADSHYNPEYLEEVRLASGGESVVIQGADHSLEIEGDTVGSIRAVEQIVRAMQRFLDP